jgi:channel protein (hemolysin III family)
MQDAITAIIPIPGFAEPVSALSHLLGAGVFLFLTPFLLYQGRGSGGRITWLMIFSISILFLLPMSGVYHLLPPGSYAREEVMRRLDHAAIFVLIAGTFTAAHGILFRGWWRWGVIGLLWAGVAVAIPLKMVFFDSTPPLLSLGLYLGFGWLGLISGTRLWRRLGYSFISPLLWGGVAYTVGALVAFLQAPVLVPGVIGPHEVFHIAVLLGLSCHWLFIWNIAGRTRRGELIPAVGLLSAAEIERLIRDGVKITDGFDFHIDVVKEDSATLRLPFSPKYLRPGGTVSGPAIMMLADTAMYAMVLAAVGPELLSVTTSMNLNFVAKPPPGDLIARGRMLKLGKRLAVMEVDIVSAEGGILVAHVTGTYSIPPKGRDAQGEGPPLDSSGIAT